MQPLGEDIGYGEDELRVEICSDIPGWDGVSGHVRLRWVLLSCPLSILVSTC